MGLFTYNHLDQISEEVVKTNLQNQRSKLKSKREQLDNLLRKQERISYQIKNLKDSIKKSSKQIAKEQAVLEKLEELLQDHKEDEESLTFLSENFQSFLVEEGSTISSKDYQRLLPQLLKEIKDLKLELNLVFDLLLKFEK